MQKATQGTALCLLAFIEVATSFHITVTFPILTSGSTTPHEQCTKAKDTSPLQEHAEGHAGYCFAPRIHGRCAKAEDMPPRQEHAEVHAGYCFVHLLTFIEVAVTIISLTPFTSLLHSPITTHSVSTTPPYTNGAPKLRTHHLCKNMQKATQGAASCLITFIKVISRSYTAKLPMVLRVPVVFNVIINNDCINSNINHKTTPQRNSLPQHSSK
ncbi:hypothetical protein EI94DRAFT_1701358 [Lactarius quietus]|nr:hypothetical protein EI94DRAFT_1701358 [Lactarius quietus]